MELLLWLALSPVRGEISKLPLFPIPDLKPPTTSGASRAVEENCAMGSRDRGTTPWSLMEVFKLEDVAESLEVPTQRLKKVWLGDVGREKGEKAVPQCLFWRFASVQRNRQIEWSGKWVVEIGKPPLFGAQQVFYKGT